MEREQLERKKLDDERMVLEASLESLLSRSLLASYMELLDSQGEEDLALLTATLQEKLTETITQTNELREVIGKLTGQIEKLEQGAEAANQRLQAESIRTTLSQHVNQYAIASFALTLTQESSRCLRAGTTTRCASAGFVLFCKNDEWGIHSR